MASNFEDIFNDEQSAAPVEAVEQPVEQPEVAPVEVPRDEHGRFAPKGEEQSASPAPVEEPPLEHPALIGERRRRQEAEARIAEYEAKLAQYQQPRQAPEPVPMPDPMIDPEGYGSYFKQELETARYQDRLYYSQQMASFKHGEEAVSEAIKWGMARCDADPYFNNKVRSSIDPVGIVVDEFKRDQIASQVNAEDWQAFQQWKSAKDAPPPAAQPPALPDSLAEAGAGRLPAASAHKPKLMSLEDILGGR